MSPRAGVPRAVRIASWSNVLATRTALVECDDAFLDGLGANGCRFIGRGAGRSYGDASYVTDGTTLSSHALVRIDGLDLERGRVVCDSGVQLGDLYARLEGTDWIVPVAGGTRWVTVGGAVASDIHGKNDVPDGSFGNHVESLELVIADGSRVECSETTRPDLFAATIGGMGLTGFIRRVTLRLRRVPSWYAHLRTAPFDDVGAMIRNFETSRAPYQVSWLDLTPPKWRGIHFEATEVPGPVEHGQPAGRPIEFDLPTVKLFAGPMVRLLNAVRYAKDVHVDRVTHLLNVLYPVDALKHWNRFYGASGFQEFQFDVPTEAAHTAMDEFIGGCRRNRLAPFFAVVKRFGDHRRKGLLSFPMPGYTLTSDFERHPANAAFFEAFTDRVMELGGRIYLAKDSAMPARQFERMYDHISEWREIVRRYDPGNRVTSDLATRLGMKPW
jgi:decaprenylphospho-beta-D-ribofuranose 2-oxidase